MIEKYPLLNEPDKTMFVFAKNGKYYGHIIKNKTAKAAAKFIFETVKFDTIEALKAEYPEQVTAK
ncbi:hypothetical protein ACFQ88_24375 [Paenibacillus sp. NPDC056579]|uniref:hypothetical protein n=1 Tax=Paenibacillus sp. NPDC056579 TaxID=3345871 RepID=UPI003674895D